MQYKCKECGCIFYFNLSYTFQKPICPQCGSINVNVKYNNYDY